MCAYVAHALGAQVLGHLQLHQRLGHDPHAFAQGVQVGFSISLAQQFGKCHAQCVGHRRWCSSLVF